MNRARGPKLGTIAVGLAVSSLIFACGTSDDDSATHASRSTERRSLVAATGVCEESTTDY